MGPRIDIRRGWRCVPGGTSAVRWLLVAAIAPAMIWLAGRGLERMWSGRPSVASAAEAAATVQQRLEHPYRTLFQELSTATQAVARQTDLVRNTRDPASGKTLFALAASLSNRLGGAPIARPSRSTTSAGNRSGGPATRRVGWTCCIWRLDFARRRAVRRPSRARRWRHGRPQQHSISRARTPST